MSKKTIQSPTGTTFTAVDLETAKTVQTEWPHLVRPGIPYTHYRSINLGEVLVDRKGYQAHLLASRSGVTTYRPGELRKRTAHLSYELQAALDPDKYPIKQVHPSSFLYLLLSFAFMGFPKFMMGVYSVVASSVKLSSSAIHDIWVIPLILLGNLLFYVIVGAYIKLIVYPLQWVLTAVEPLLISTGPWLRRTVCIFLCLVGNWTLFHVLYQ